MPSAEDLFTDVRVVELSTVTRDGGLNTKPMSASWLPDSQQIVLTTPPAYPQKVYNIRRDGRVALLYSDLRGSGLPAGTSVLVQGLASAPDVVAPPQDLPDYWRGLFRKNPHLADGATEEQPARPRTVAHNPRAVSCLSMIREVGKFSMDEKKGRTVALIASHSQR